MTRRRASLAGAAAAVLLGVLPLAAQQSEVQAGQAVFGAKCAACHSLDTNRLVGPGLRGVTARRERAWLVRWIAGPDRVLAAGDPIARQLLQEYNQLPMPNLALTEREAASVVAFLDAQVAGAVSAAPPAAPLGAGDAIRGKALFTGEQRFQSGGPPCLACHSVAGIGALGGGALGPDLTPARSKYGDAGLAAILANIPFPTMRPIFAAHPLTPAEQANLRTFLGQAVALRPSRAIAQLTLLGAIGTMMLFGLAHLTWRGRLTTVRRHMVESERSGSDPKRVSNR